MPVYNTDAHLSESISSILSQYFRDFEFVIVDDGSTDSSASIIRDFAARDARIRPIFASHGGRGRAANLAIAAARGRLIARMDSDDVAPPERLGVQLEWMQRHDLDICGVWAKRFGRDNRIIWFPTHHSAIHREMLFRCALLQSGVLMRADIAKCHPYDETVAFEDYELWTRLVPLYRTGNVPQILHHYRMHRRQSHIVETDAHLRDLLRFQQRLLESIFPDAGREDRQVFAPLTARREYSDLASLERAGHWLVRLAMQEDAKLSRAMAKRWLLACYYSAALGPGCTRLYRRIAQEFPGGYPVAARYLPVLCVLRVGYSSPVVRATSTVVRFFRSLRRTGLRQLWLACRP